MNSNYNDFSILDILNIFSVGLQVMNLEQTTKQTSTDDIMRELHRQDREYMEKIIAQNNKIILETFKTQSYEGANALFYDSFDFNADQWYIINIKHEQKGIYECSVYDEKYNELYNKTQNSGHEVTNQSDTLILGNDIDLDSGGATLKFDLSETYFKNGDTIISEWNL